MDNVLLLDRLLRTIATLLILAFAVSAAALIVESTFAAAVSTVALAVSVALETAESAFDADPPLPLQEVIAAAINEDGHEFFHQKFILVVAKI